MALETELARASRTRVALRDPESNYNLRTLVTRQAEAPGFDWGAYLARRGVPARQILDAGQPEFFTAFARLATRTPAATWRAYLRWHVVRALAPFLPRRFEDARFASMGRR